jgi:hypothetical protein
MGGRKSKQKGNRFELTIVKLIRKAVSKKFSDEVCYRTPASGGHYIIGGCDIQLKSRLRKIFNFDAECKDWKTIAAHKFFKLHEDMKKFLKQALENTEEKGGYPLLVLHGPRIPIFCCAKEKDLTEAGYSKLLSDDIPALRFKYRGRMWRLMLFEFMLDELKRKVKKL